MIVNNSIASKFPTTEWAFITLDKKLCLKVFLDKFKSDFMILSSKLFHSLGAEKKKRTSNKSVRTVFAQVVYIVNIDVYWILYFSHNLSLLGEHFKFEDSFMKGFMRQDQN